MADDLTQDYQRLIAEGGIVRDCADESAVDAWRAGMRERAKADRLTIRTGTADQMPMRAWAALPETPAPQSDDEVRRLLNDHLDRS